MRFMKASPNFSLMVVCRRQRPGCRGWIRGGDVDYIRVVDTGEGGGELFFDVFEKDLLEGAAGFDKKIFVFLVMGGWGCGMFRRRGGLRRRRKIGFDLLQSGVKAFEGDRF
jgi:hypothetical protein